MKKIGIILATVILVGVLSACNTSSVSNKDYAEISRYVLENLETFSVEKDVEFFDFKAEGLSVSGVYYGYYYTKNNDILLPDFYQDHDREKIETQQQKADGGTYFGKPHNGTDWCYVKSITDHWYYYELHWG